ncbi:hypothetical protein ACFY36_18195 [Actinoplanes sp. NPDC000266]
MKLASPPPQRNRSGFLGSGTGIRRQRDNRSDVSFETQPLVSRDEERFLDGDLNAAEYLSRVSAEPLSGEPFKKTSYQRIELFLSLTLCIAGLAFFFNATKLFTDGGDLALLGLLVSGSAILLLQLILELRRLRRHGGFHEPRP